LVVAEAGSPAPLRDDAQLHSRLADLVAAEFGGAADDWRTRVATGLRTLEEHCRGGPAVAAWPARQGGTRSWWDRYVDEPLGRRACPDLVRLDAVPLNTVLSHSESVGAPAPSAEAVPEPAAKHVVGGEEVLAAVLTAARTSVAQPGRGDPARRLTAVLRSVTADLVERRALADDVAARFVADPARVRAAVEELLTLVAA
jgi:hypothetical protein